MTTINLRDYYPFYTEDTFIEVSDELAAQFHRFDLDDEAYRIRVYRAKAYFSLDCDDGIEGDAICKPLTPDELLDRELTAQLLYEAMTALPPAQARRVYARIVFKKSSSQIARAEGVDESSVRKTVAKGLAGLKKYLKDLL